MPTSVTRSLRLSSGLSRASSDIPPMSSAAVRRSGRRRPRGRL
jgi:hypothetical protein